MPVCMWKVVHWQTFSVFLEIEPSSHVEPQSSCKNNKKGKREETKRLPLVFPCVLEDKLAKCRSMGWDHKASNSWWRIQLSLYLESLCVRVCVHAGGGCVYLWLPHQHTKPQTHTHTQWLLSITWHTGHHTHSLWTSSTDKHANRRLLFRPGMTILRLILLKRHLSTHTFVFLSFWGVLLTMHRPYSNPTLPLSLKWHCRSL